MKLLWLSICFVVFFIYSVDSDTIESFQSKPGERTESSGSHKLSSFDSNIYPTQSLHNSNGYNSNPNSLSLGESNSESQSYNSRHQTNDESDKKERKTLILAIPVKLSLPKSEQDSYDSQSSIETHQYSKNPYPSPYSSSVANHLSRHHSLLSADSDDSNSQKPITLPPLSQKIYSSIDSQLKSATYSAVNTQKSISEQPSSLSSANEQKYRNTYETKDKFGPNHYERNANTYRPNPIREEYKGLNNEGYDNNYGTDKYKTNKNGQLTNKYVEDFYEDRVKQREISKQMYDTIPDNKPEYDYDSGSEEEDEEEDNKKAEDIYYSAKDYNNNNKKGFRLKNYRKNNFNAKKTLSKPDVNPLFFKNNKQNAQILPVFAAEPFDEWTQYYLSKLQTNGWARLPDSTDNNMLSLLNSQKNLNKDNLQNPLYAPAFDLFTDTQLKSASNPIAFKTLENSKIYGPAAKFQSSYPPLNMFTGFGRDYSLMDLSGDLYPAPLVAQTTPLRNQHNLLQQNEYKGDHNSANRDLILPNRRNPLLLRPSFMSGLRSAASKPLANYSPFTSASNTHSLLSVLPSLPSLPSLQTSFNINSKSIPRQIFPLLYG